jgi:large subunit ribosomal protein L25
VAITTEAARPLVASGAKVFDLEIDGQSEKVLLREVQWDTFGVNLLHLDFMRIDAEQRIVVDVPLHLKGTAPGVVAGGILEQPLHSVHLECLAIEVPDEIPVRVGALELGQSIHVRDLTDLPASAVLKTPLDAVVVHCVKPREEAELTATPGPAEPEVIGKKKEDAEES